MKVTKEMEATIKSLGHDPEWSLCKIHIEDSPRFLFRLLSMKNIPEASGDTVSEAVEKYILDLRNIKSTKK